MLYKYIQFIVFVFGAGIDVIRIACQISNQFVIVLKEFGVQSLDVHSSAFDVASG